MSLPHHILKDIISHMILHKGDCMGIACEHCPFGMNRQGIKYDCTYTSEDEIYTAAKGWMYKYYPSVYFDLMI